MNRTTLNAVLLCVWMTFALVLMAGHRAIQDAVGDTSFGRGNPPVITAILYAFAVMFGVVMHMRLLDYFAPMKHEVKALTDDERRERIIKEGEEARREGRLQTALGIFEANGLLGSALDIAQETGDKAALARISARMGRHERARKLYIELGDFESAGHMSNFLGEGGAARGHYRKAALMHEKAGKRESAAAMWDRAGEFEKAAHLYEQLGDMKRASECQDLAGDTERARTSRDQAQVIDAYERRKGLRDENLAERRQDLLKSAELHESIGDFFGAGEAYRDIDEFEKAALAFEQVEQWERAARMQDLCKNPEKARLLREHHHTEQSILGRRQAAEAISQVSPTSPPQVETSPTKPAAPAVDPLPAAPSPAVLAAAFTNAVQQQQFVPVHQALGLRAAPAMASAPVTPADFQKSAAALEQAGDLLSAADVYRQVGRFDNSVDCLEQAGRFREAALMAHATGRRDRAVQLLLEEFGKNNDPEVGFLLAELLVERGKHFKAMEILYRHLGRGGVTESNAAVYYRFARMFENHGARWEALRLYQDMMASGAVSEDVTSRARDLEDRLRRSGEKPPPGLEFTESKPLPPPPKKTAGDFLRGMLDDSSDAPPGAGETAQPDEAPTIDLARPRKAFPFTPPNLLRPGDLPIPNPKAEAESLYAPMREMSLFAPIADVLARAGKQSASANANPFAPEHRYAIRRELGRGGMGVIYEAEDTALGRRVALKVISNHAASAEDMQQFLVEARAIARMSHPNVVAIYDIGLMDLRQYIAMELVAGRDLRNLIRDEKQLPLKEALRLFAEIGRGLATAHQAGVVHRDIKPANVLLTEERQVKIVDFGLAKLCERDGADSDDPSTNFRSAGTPGYMAPEQIEGGELLPRCDIYAMGITLFAMLVGETPHQVLKLTKSHDIMELHLRGDLPRPADFRPDLPPAVQQLYEFCTRSRPEERYQSISAFLPSVEAWLGAF